MGAVDLSERIAREMAKKYGYLPGDAKQLAIFVKSVHNFSHYLGVNKYYSDVLNKRIALLTLDCDILSLRVERVRLMAESFYSQMELATLAKKPAEIDKKKVEEFKTQMAGLLDESLKMHDRAIKLMRDIREEYASHGMET